MQVLLQRRCLLAKDEGIRKSPCSIHGQTRGYSRGYSSDQFCWAPSCFVLTGRNNNPVECHAWKILGSWWWTQAMEERSWPRYPPEWCDLLDCWTLGCCRGIIGVWKELRQILEWQIIHQAGMYEYIFWTPSCLWGTQLKEKIILTFERVHGPGYQALFLIDNSQGHSAYAEDALMVSHMNVNPGGKQARMWDGWFVWDGVKVPQAMVFPEDHPDYSNKPKGIKFILTKHGHYQFKLHGKCQSQCKDDATVCCNKRILELEPDFQAQKSLVQETIEDAGHLCLFLPKFHCELNFIEFFWESVRKYIWENCGGTFEMLKKNLPLALQSVQLSTICLWEHHTHRWMNAYRAGLDTKAAQVQVWEFSSKKYKSHRRVPEAVASSFDFQIE